MGTRLRSDTLLGGQHAQGPLLAYIGARLAGVLSPVKKKDSITSILSSVRAGGLDNFHRQKPRDIVVVGTSRKIRILQPVEDLVGVDVIPPCDLTDGYTGEPRLRADHPFLVVAPIPAPAPLRHPKPR